MAVFGGSERGVVVVIFRARDGMDGADRVPDAGMGGTGGRKADVSAELRRSTRTFLTIILAVLMKLHWARCTCYHFAKGHASSAPVSASQRFPCPKYAVY